MNTTKFNNRPWTPQNYMVVPNRKLLFSLGEGELKIFLALCDFADGSGQCYPSFETLAARAGYKRRQTINIIGKLVARGMLKVIKRKLKGEINSSNVYQIMELPTPQSRSASIKAAVENSGGSATASALGSAKLNAPGGSAIAIAPRTKPTLLTKPNEPMENRAVENQDVIDDDEKARRQRNLEYLRTMKAQFVRRTSRA